MGTSSNTIVAARVPEEIKEQGNAILSELGYTQTQLINSAYRYILEFRRLPFETALPRPGKRSLEPKRLRQLYEELASLSVCKYDYTLDNTRTFKEALTESLKLENEMLV